MYSFLHEGEFVQITIEASPEKPDVVTGFVSRFGATDSDRGAILDHFFNAGSLQGTTIKFSTKIVHEVSYDFVGTISRGQAKSHAEEGYYIIRGTLIETTMVDGKPLARSREITMKMFPELDNTPMNGQ